MPHSSTTDKPSHTPAQSSSADPFGSPAQSINCITTNETDCSTEAWPSDTLIVKPPENISVSLGFQDTILSFNSIPSVEANNE